MRVSYLYNISFIIECERKKLIENGVYLSKKKVDNFSQMNENEKI